MKRFLLILSISLISYGVLDAQASHTNTSGQLNNQTPILRFYPNPATTVITFDFQKGFEKGYSIQIYNFLGRQVMDLPNINTSTTVNLSDFTRGVYIYQLRDHTGRIVEAGKFQVSK